MIYFKRQFADMEKLAKWDIQFSFDRVRSTFYKETNCCGIFPFLFRKTLDRLRFNAQIIINFC